ncbi:hypothetical protein MYMA111404_00065 [Mycoplasma marinum]|uniref:Uncharacterized protein n=1 Tax=Mycoplasma marinum TaxID=1937190 RepID=A0A4R0XLV9_9MOLU|nr:hypothetical protein [Mycoplasma marinum]TCG11699.1 hypothetical protein C4B24_00910 [Mycoplasma marinum]
MKKIFYTFFGVIITILAMFFCISSNATKQQQINLSSHYLKNGVNHYSSTNSITESDMEKLYKDDSSINTIDSLVSLGKISRVSVTGFSNLDSKELIIKELQIIDASNKNVPYKLKSINYDNPYNENDKIESSQTNNYGISDNNFDENKDHSLIIKNNFSNKNIGLEIVLDKPSLIKDIKISQKVKDSIRYIGQVKLISDDYKKIFRTKQLSNKIVQKSKSNFNLEIGAGKIIWDYFSSNSNKDNSFLYVPNLNSIQLKYPLSNWNLEWWVNDDNEQFKDFIPDVHGGFQKTNFILTNKQSIANTKEFQITNDEKVNLNQALSFLKETNDLGIEQSFITLFDLSKISPPSSIKGLTVSKFQDLIASFRNRINPTISINLFGDQWEGQRNSISNLVIISFLSNTSKLNFGSTTFDRNDYNYYSNIFYLSWIGDLSSLKTIKVYGDTSLSFKGHIILTGDPNDGQYISNLDSLQSIDIASYYTSSNLKLLDKIAHSKLWMDFYKKKSTMKKNVSVIVDAKNYTLSKFPTKFLYGQIDKSNNKVILSPNFSQVFKKIISPRYDQILNDFTMLHVDNKFIKSFYLEGKLYWDYFTAGISPKDIFAYYKDKNKYITHKYQSDNSISNDDLITLDQIAYTPKIMGSFPKINTQFSINNKIAPKIFIDGDPSNVIIFKSKYIIDNPKYYQSKYYYIKNGIYHLFTSFKNVMQKMNLSQIQTNKVSEFDNSHVDKSDYNELKKTTLPSIQQPVINNEGKLIGDKFVSVDSKNYGGFFIYKGKPHWNFEGNLKESDIKYYSLGKYYTSINNIPPKDFAFVSEVSKISEITPTDTNYYLPVPPTHNDFIKHKNLKIIVDDVEYGIALKNGETIWNYDLSNIKYVTVDNGIKYYTKWEYVLNKAKTFSVHPTSFILEKNKFLEINRPWESRFLLVNDDGVIRKIPSILIKGKWYWKLSSDDAKKIKYVSNNGTYFTNENLTKDIIQNNYLTSVKILDNIWTSKNPIQVDQFKKLTSKNIDNSTSFMFNSKIYNFIFKDGNYYIPNDIYDEIQYTTFVGGITKFYNSYVLIPPKEYSNANSAILSGSKLGDFNGVSILDIFDNKKTKVVKVQTKNNIFVNIEISTRDNVIFSKDLSILKDVNYIGKSGTLYQKVSNVAADDYISNLHFSLQTLNSWNDAITFNQNQLQAKNRYVSYTIIGFASCILFLIMIVAISIKLSRRKHV